MKQMTLKLHSMYAAANKLGYSLPFMNEICKRAFWSDRSFLVLKDENIKYFIEANSLQRYINTCSDFNPYEIPDVNEPDSDDEDAPMDDTVFMLDDDMRPQVCGVEIDEECAPLIAYHRDEVALIIHGLRAMSVWKAKSCLQSPMAAGILWRKKTKRRVLYSATIKPVNSPYWNRSA